MSLNESKVACKKLKDKWIPYECMLISLHSLSVLRDCLWYKGFQSMAWHGKILPRIPF